MTSKLRFILGIHCHQPVGNFDYVFEHGYQVSYKPFLETLARFPALKVSLHYSGPLLEWLSERHPEFFSLISGLLKKGQLEIIGGGYYEPILPVIPREDSLGQLRYMSRYLAKHFGVKVRGAWLTERIWEPGLPGLLAEAGLEFTTVDDFHFLAAGFDTEKLHGYYLSEDGGAMVKIFPISQRLRYLIPFHPLEEVIDYFRQKARTLPDHAAIVLADDGEKFGMWPGTHDWVYRQGWLERFFTTLTESSDWLEPVFFNEVLDSTPSTGQVYLPCSSYFEMGGWSLPAEAGERLQKLKLELETEGRLETFTPFLRGSFWRNFLTKYPESGWMHKRMLDTSRRVHTALGEKAENSQRLPAALRRLWMAQCNCAYWHGIFGGLYLPHLRKAVYTCLIQAEKLIAKGGSGTPRIQGEESDIDLDGHPEVRLANEHLSLYIKPSRGGAVVELDDFASEFNLIDTLARRREAYHYQMAEGGEQGSDQRGHASIHERQFPEKLPQDVFVYDPYPRWMFREHFLERTPRDFQEASRGEPEELGDFADSSWNWRLLVRKGTRAACALNRSGQVRLPSGECAALRLGKRISLVAGSRLIEADYRLENLEKQPLEFVFGISFNLTVLGPADPKVGLICEHGSAMSLAQGSILQACKELTVFNHRENVNLRLGFSLRTSCVVQYPVETVSQSESGIDLTYQATCLLPLWPVKLNPLSSKSLKLTLTLFSEKS